MGVNGGWRNPWLGVNGPCKTVPLSDAETDAAARPSEKLAAFLDLRWARRPKRTAQERPPFPKPWLLLVCCWFARTGSNPSRVL